MMNLRGKLREAPFLKERRAQSRRVALKRGAARPVALVHSIAQGSYGLIIAIRFG